MAVCEMRWGREGVLVLFPSTLGYFVPPQPNVPSAVMTSASVWPAKDF